MKAFLQFWIYCFHVDLNYCRHYECFQLVIARRLDRLKTFGDAVWKEFREEALNVAGLLERYDIALPMNLYIQ